MSIYSVAVTEAGAQLLLQAAGGGTLTFTRAQLGSGIYMGDLSGRTELVTPVCYTSIDAPTLDGDVIRVPVLFTNRVNGGYVDGFTINEIGLWARLAGGTETLLAYANAGADADGISVPGDALTEFTYIIKLRFSGAADVTMSAEGVDYVTQEALETALADKADKTHTHTQADVIWLSEALAGKAPNAHAHGALTSDGKISGANSANKVLATDADGNVGAYAGEAVRELIGAAGKMVAQTATATAAGWTGSKAPFTQVISISGMTAACNAIVGLANTATREQNEACMAALIRPTAQTAGAVTLSAEGRKPEIDLPVTAYMWGVE